MNEKYLIYGAIAGIVILTLGVVWYYRQAIKNKLNDPKFKDFLHKMMLQAEEYFNSGEGQKKSDWEKEGMDILLTKLGIDKDDIH